MKPDSRKHWDHRYKQSAGSETPASFLTEIAQLLPTTGSMVDVAGGSGRNALWFARLGFETTVVDISGEALRYVGEAASAGGLEVERINRDLETEGMPPGRSWDVALMHLYSNRDVLAALPGSLNPRGLLLFAQPTVVNLERHERPGPRFLLKLGELAGLAEEMTDIDVVRLTEGWEASGRHEARLVARKRTGLKGQERDAEWPATGTNIELDR